MTRDCSLEVRWETEVTSKPPSREASWAPAGVRLSLWYSAKLGLGLGWVQRLPPGQTAPRSTFPKDMDNACPTVRLAIRRPTLELLDHLDTWGGRAGAQVGPNPLHG